MEKIKNVVIFVLFFMFCFLLLFSISKRDKYEKEIYILKSKASAYDGVVRSFQIMEEFARKNNLKIDDIIKFYTINDSIYITKTDVNKIKKMLLFGEKIKCILIQIGMSMMKYIILMVGCILLLKIAFLRNV